MPRVRAGGREGPEGRRGASNAPVCWIAGRPAAGKTTLARRLAGALRARGSRCEVLDSDEAREVITPSPTYSAGERLIFYRALAYAARRLAEAGIVAVVAATAGSRELHEAVRAACPSIVVVHARCDPETAAARDPKGLYAAARADPSSTLPGVGTPFDPPTDPDWVVDTDRPVPDEAVARLADRLLA
ncbi:MAG TPA: adenylyl-sulfate kinase [Vulgatibacter sp.]|nr:adenylyl-sulfate kinase [Vulgatibacter sp.]